MRNIIIGIIVILLLGGFELWYHFGTAASTLATTPQTDTSTDTSSSGSVPQGQSAPTQASGYKDGTYTGSVSTNLYGPVQVSATIADGKITAVTFLQHPDSQQESVQVSAMAIPQLQSEAIAAQSANVNIVSGATQTSQSFQESLGAALSQAQS